MANLSPKQSIGFGLLCIICSYLLSHGVVFLANLLGILEPSMIQISNLLFEVLCLLGIGLVAFNKEAFNIKVARFVSLGYFVFIAFFCVSILISLCTDVNPFSYLGTYASVIICSLVFILAGITFFGLKTSYPIKIVCALSLLPQLINSFFQLELKQAWEVYNETGNFDTYGAIINRMYTSDYIADFLWVAAIVLIVLWMTKKTKAPSAQNTSNYNII